MFTTKPTQAYIDHVNFMEKELRRLNKTKDEDLFELAIEEMSEKQRIYSVLLDRLDKLEGITRAQVLELIRLMILIWWYYKPIKPCNEAEIPENIMNDAITKQNEWIIRHNNASAAESTEMRMDRFEKHPASWLQLRIATKIHTDTSSELYKLSKKNKGIVDDWLDIAIYSFHNFIKHEFPDEPRIAAISPWEIVHIGD